MGAESLTRVLALWRAASNRMKFGQAQALERLAELLVAAALNRPELKRRLRMELPDEEGADHLLPEIDKRLGALDTCRSKVSWRQSSTFLRDLNTIPLSCG